MSQIKLDNHITGPLPPAARPAAKVAGVTGAAGPNFGQVLQTQVQDQVQSQFTAQAARAGVKFSGHAQTRLTSRQITLSGEEITRLGVAMTRAAQKGARSSLMLTDKAALVVSVPNRTVITAVDRASLKDNIFTNIDSAMIL